MDTGGGAYMVAWLRWIGDPKGSVWVGEILGCYGIDRRQSLRGQARRIEDLACILAESQRQHLQTYLQFVKLLRNRENYSRWLL